MGSYGRVRQLLLVFVLALTVKEVVSSGRNLLQTSSTCNTCTDYAVVMDTSTTDYPSVNNAAGSFMTSMGGPCNRFYVSNCDGRGVKSQLSGCTTDQGYASKLCFNGGFSGGYPDHASAIRDAVDKLKQQSSPPGQKKMCALFLSNSRTSSSSAALNSATQYAHGNGVDLVVFDFGTPKSWASGLCSSNNYVNIPIVPNTNWWTPCGQWRPKPVNCPLQCQNVVLNLVADKTTKMCSAKACSSTTISSSTCYQVYKSGLMTGGTISATALPAVAVGTTVSAVTVTSSSMQPSCTGTVTINCYPPPQCTTNRDCASVLPVPKTAVCTQAKCVSGKCAYAPARYGTPCDDGNACTGSPPGAGDVCNGNYYGGAGCTNPGFSPRTCADAIPPGLGSMCYGPGQCSTVDGTCSFPLLPTALNQAISANSYCGTWGGAFAAQLVNGDNSISPQGSTVFSKCSSLCITGTCASDIVPQCSCNTFASSYSFAQAGTAPPCPTALATQTNGISCKNGVLHMRKKTNAATCWYPDANVKSGEGGMLSLCPGQLYTEYVLTGGTSISQCMGCVSFGAAYSANSTTCYAGNVSKPVDP